MMLDPAIAAAERTDEARRLIARAQTDTVDLVTISALDLCVLGGPAHPLFEQTVASTWMKLGERRQRKVTAEVTARLVRRGLLIDDNAQRGSRDSDGGTYSLQPQLGLMLAARCRPAFVVAAAIENGQGLRPLSLFALGDLVESVRGIVAELPAGLPPDRDGDYPDVRKLGPLGWIYRYVLVPPPTAAEILAKWTITPPARPGTAVAPRYLVSAYRPDRENPHGYHLGVRGNGTRAILDQPGHGNSELATADYDLEGLQAVMLQLLAEASR
jgi:hypothetical protein